ncbi:hypothetical protein [Paenibacillus curdlanolyticus]|uniref:hypothetical protein n=1 Tax=Paenibacillus curdlanolyticus TaxID=59840 RepID=UPI001184B652|nr:hypothetical protein [Paenibacillus curdlanolyticus]
MTTASKAQHIPKDPFVDIASSLMEITNLLRSLATCNEAIFKSLDKQSELLVEVSKDSSDTNFAVKYNVDSSMRSVSHAIECIINMQVEQRVREAIKDGDTSFSIIDYITTMKLDKSAD